MSAASEPDNRREQRRRTLKGGRMVFNDGRSTIDCRIRNLSDSGARLEVNSVIGIPDAFELMLDDGSRRSCRVAWRRAGELGVAFETTG